MTSSCNHHRSRKPTLAVRSRSSSKNTCCYCTPRIAKGRKLQSAWYYMCTDAKVLLSLSLCITQSETKCAHKTLRADEPQIFEAKVKSFQLFVCPTKDLSIPFIYNHTRNNIKMASTVRFFVDDSLLLRARGVTLRRPRDGGSRRRLQKSRGPLREAFPNFFFLCSLRGWISENAMMSERRN